MTSRILDRLGGRADGQPLSPRGVAALYLAFGLFLLLASDLLLPLWLSGPTLREVQGVKALAEVLASAALVYVLVATAQRQLRLQDRAMDEAPIGITIADARRADNPLVSVNEGFEAITGYDEREALGRNPRFLQGPNTDPEPVAELRAAIEADRPVEVDVRNYRADGTPFWNRLTLTPVTDASGTVTHYLGLQRDVTASKERKQRLAVLNRVLRHNMRNKLNVIRGRTEQLQSARVERTPPERGERTAADPATASDPSAVDPSTTDPPTAGPSADSTTPDEAAEACRAIHDATDELLAIADQVRAFDVVLDDDDRELHEVDLATLVRDVAVAVGDRHPAASVRVDTPAHATVRVHGTVESALESVLELVATGEGAAATVRVRDEGDAVVTEIRDRGDTLTAAELGVVAHGTETPLEHILGLELWLVRWAIEQSRGEFEVDTESDDLGVRLRFVRETTGTA